MEYYYYSISVNWRNYMATDEIFTPSQKSVKLGNKIMVYLNYSDGLKKNKQKTKQNKIKTEKIKREWEREEERGKSHYESQFSTSFYLGLAMSFRIPVLNFFELILHEKEDT